MCPLFLSAVGKFSLQMHTPVPLYQGSIFQNEYIQDVRLLKKKSQVECFQDLGQARSPTEVQKVLVSNQASFKEKVGQTGKSQWKWIEENWRVWPICKWYVCHGTMSTQVCKTVADSFWMELAFRPIQHREGSHSPQVQDLYTLWIFQWQISKFRLVFLP